MANNTISAEANFHQAVLGKSTTVSISIDPDKTAATAVQAITLLRKSCVDLEIDFWLDRDEGEAQAPPITASITGTISQIRLGDKIWLTVGCGDLSDEQIIAVNQMAGRNVDLTIAPTQLAFGDPDPTLEID